MILMFQKLSEKDRKAYNLIKQTILNEGRKPTLKEINEVTEGKSPRSAIIVIERLERIGLLKRVGVNIKLIENSSNENVSIETIEVPLLGTVTCGMPMFAEENIEAHISVSTSLAKRGNKYFLLRASGTSMNLAGINDKDILLIRQQNTAQNNERVVALINDEATVKIFERTGDVIILRPKSTEQKHKPIILTENCQIQGVVIAVLPSDLN
jgi:repressor LexA